jgi:2-polyprenyl-3-methyl-5-hydroxy-6-metoxy-1,4-benzoquinol methylase
VTPASDNPADELGERLFGAYLGALELGTIYLGDRLQLYATLHRRGPSTTAELADAAGIHERYAREWLEQQAVSGFVVVDDVEASAAARRYHLPAAHAGVLLERDSPCFFAPHTAALRAILDALPDVMEAFRSGGGVPLDRYGEDFRAARAEATRPLYLDEVGRVWLASVPDVHERLSAEPAARVADMACGAGWSTISLALAYPNTIVDGLDLDARSIELAARNLVGSGAEDRVRFRVADAADPGLAGSYDVVTIFEAIHDMADPVGVLRSARRMLVHGGTVLVGDPRAAERFTVPGDELERVIYATSVLHCLPTGMATQPSAGTGAAMRPATFAEYAHAAGFTAVETLPIEQESWRFHLLRP